PTLNGIPSSKKNIHSLHLKLIPLEESTTSSHWETELKRFSKSTENEDETQENTEKIDNLKGKEITNFFYMCSRPFFHIIKLLPSNESDTKKWKGKDQDLDLNSATVIGFSFANEDDANKLGFKIKYFVEGDSLNVMNNVASKLRKRANPEKS